MGAKISGILVLRSDRNCFLLDVLASVIGLGKREFGALSRAVCCFEAAKREEVQFGRRHYFD